MKSWKAVVYSGTSLVSIETVDNVSLGGIAGIANARLAAAAPDLVDALEEALNLLEATHISSPLGQTLEKVTRLRKTITMATGGVR